MLLRCYSRRGMLGRGARKGCNAYDRGYILRFSAFHRILGYVIELLSGYSLAIFYVEMCFGDG